MAQIARKSVQGDWRRFCGPYEIKAYERHLRDLERQDTPEFPYVFDETRADRIVRFFLQLRHVRGPLAGQPIRLDPCQIFDLGCVYGWVHRETGARRFSVTYNKRARGNWKSTEKSGQALYHMCADAIYPPYLPEAARFELAPEVDCAAVDRGQAQRVFGDARLMALGSPAIAKRLKIPKSETAPIKHLKRGGFLRALSKDTKNKDSGAPCYVVVDEYHAHPTSMIYDVEKNSLGKRWQCLLDVITTAGDDAQTKPCYREELLAKQILDGDVVAEHYFVMIREIPADGNPHDKTLWPMANPALRAVILADELQAARAEAEADGTYPPGPSGLPPLGKGGKEDGRQIAAPTERAGGASPAPTGNGGRPQGSPLQYAEIGAQHKALETCLKAAEFFGGEELLLQAAEYGRTLFKFVLDDYVEAYGSNDPDKIRAFLTRRMDLWQIGAVNHYLNEHCMELVRKCMVKPEEFARLTDGLECWPGFDLGKRIDLSGVGAVFLLPDGFVAARMHGFIPEGAAQRHEKTDRVPYLAWEKGGYITLTPGEVTDNSYVNNWIRAGELQHGWQVVEICYDGHNATDLAIQMAEERNNPDICVEISQSCAGQNIAVKGFRDLLLSGKLILEESPLVLWCLANAVEIQNNFGDIKLSKKHKDDTERIDPVAATMNGLARALVRRNNPTLADAIGSGEWSM